MAEKKTIVIEMSTNFLTGVTSLVGVTNAPCPRCGSQKTSLRGREIVCLEKGCETEKS